MSMSVLETAGDDKEALTQLAAVLAQQLPKDKIVYTYCASGYRSLKAATTLEKFGYDVRPLKAGYKQLVEQGFPKAGQ